ncbi:TorD/DmsD family molecular chaperone [Caldilinea sp.]|jgi:TorA maturation chaperone TorD|uniref:TorD/DmsD family molecular chaperone n=1 Tax=Caldilinea sp. TaxID=2293560 RepID=UPI0026321D26|nr:molecular chaperone TorD family protein [uncultured Caldilinea sp.]
MFTPHQAAQAYAQAFDLFARLYRHGLTPALVIEAAQLPDLAAVAPQPYDADEAAAAFHTLFAMNVFPYQSVFLDPDGLLGGGETDRVRAGYRRMGFVVDEANEPADHLAHELDALAFLCQAEAEAWEDERWDMVARAQQLQADFLDGHLLRWLPAFTAAVQRQEEPFYAGLAELTLALAAERRRSLEPGRLGVQRARDEDIALTPRSHLNGAGDALTLTPADEPPAQRVERLLANPQTDLDAIAAFLLTPAYSGLFLSRRDIGRLGRAAEAPHGFGERRQMLRTFLRSAAEFDRFDAALAGLRSLVEDTAWTLRRWGSETVSLSTVQPWLDRLSATRRLLETLEAMSPSASQLRNHGVNFHQNAIE